MSTIRTFLAACLLLTFASFSYATEPYRVIAIMENERLLEAEPNIKLTDFFKSTDPAIRRRAILAAARIGNKVVIPELTPLGNDKDVEVRRMVG
jgi:hypothetical protein